MLAFSSAFSVFALEVSWFRSIRAAHQATTETFAVLIAAFLIALSLGAWLSPRLRERFPGALPFVIVAAAFAVLYDSRRQRSTRASSSTAPPSAR